MKNIGAPEIPEKFKELRDATINLLGFSPDTPNYNLVTSMTDALYQEGHLGGIRFVMELLKERIVETEAKALINEILEDLSLDRKTKEGTIDKTLDEVNKKNGNKRLN